MAISSTLPRLAEAATQPLAALVQPVLIPLAPLYLPSSSLVVSDVTSSESQTSDGSPGS